MPGRHEVVTVINDPVMYGKIPLTAFEAKLMDTPPVLRLRDVAVASNFRGSLPILPRNTHRPIPGSRRDHLFGSLYGATYATEQPFGKMDFEDSRKYTAAACALHDLGDAPFSHAAEEQMILVTGKNHEERAYEVMLNSPSLRRLLANELGSEGIDMLGAAIRGETRIKGEYCPWVLMVNAGHGGIDIDNIDNIQRSLITRGITNFKHYDPLRIYQAFGIFENDLVLRLRGLHDLNGWIEARKLLFHYINAISNMAPQTFGESAMDLARKAGSLLSDFFDMTDSQAMSYLLDLKRVPMEVRTIFSRISKINSSEQERQKYRRIYFWSEENPSKDELNYVSDPQNKYQLRDEICKLLDIPVTDIAVQMGRDKGYRDISMPILLDGELTQFQQPHSKKLVTLQVFLYKDRRVKVDEDELIKVVDRERKASKVNRENNYRELKRAS